MYHPLFAVTDSSADLHQRTQVEWNVHSVNSNAVARFLGRLIWSSTSNHVHFVALLNLLLREVDENWLQPVVGFAPDWVVPYNPANSSNHGYLESILILL
jgi:hypothetical protein